MNVLSADLSANKLRIAIVSASWHATIGQGLVDGALSVLRAAGCDQDHVTLIDVPGTFELPQGCKYAADSKKFDAIIALGVVIRGETPHFDYICSSAAHGINQVGVSSGIPVTFGVITADTVAQAVARSGATESNKGREAADAALKMAALKNALSK